MQFHRIMAPIFARLGVTLITRNISQGGMGTLQNSLGSGDIYGNKVDILIWDSGMTEKTRQDHIDFFFRQGLIGGVHVPVLWSAGGQYIYAVDVLMMTTIVSLKFNCLSCCVYPFLIIGF